MAVGANAAGPRLCPDGQMERRLVWGCGAATGIEVTGDEREPPRWYCLSGHSGYFHAPAVLTGRHPAPPGDPHVNRRPYTRCCSECGEPVKASQRKCAECRIH